MRIEIHQPLYIYELGRRTNQEDALWPLPDTATPADRLFIVCDGMGGHEKGEVASQTVCQALGTWFQDNVNPDEPFTDDLLREALAYAYEQLDRQDDGSPKKMGTTLTLLYIHARGITAAHIGDSRIYHIRPCSSPTGEAVRGLLYQSRDHSLVYDLYQSGEISYEEMFTSPQKNIITRAMQPGEDNRVRPDIIHITDIQSGDWFYLCSDGMLEQMRNEELATLFSSEVSDVKKRQQLIDATKGSQDNHTAWLLHIKNVELEEGDRDLENEEFTSRCNALNIHRDKAKEAANMDIFDDEDVVMVSPPASIKKPRWKSIFKPVACLLKRLRKNSINKKNHEPTRHR